MTVTNKFWILCAGLNGFVAIVMGAVAAHVLTDVQRISMAEKAALYALIHSVLLAALVSYRGIYYSAARWTFLSGILLFCGSLYIRAVSGWSAATMVAPLGGLCLMAGWILMAVAASNTEQS